MSQQTNIAVIGGDSRFLHTAKRLYAAGYSVFVSLFEKTEIPETIYSVKPEEAMQVAELILLPLPVSKDNKNIFAPYTANAMPVSDFLLRIKHGVTVFCGMPTEEMTKILEAKKCTVIDYYAREEFQLKNAVLTAEGALDVIINKLPVSVYGLSCAITGYGRVGELTARLLYALGAEVTVFARSNRDRTRAQINGLHAYSLYELSEHASRFNCIINTVPAPVINESVLRNTRQDCFLLELASAPYGIDSDTAAQRGLSYMRASSLPGKTAPQSAGESIAETIHSILSEGSS